MKKYKVQSVKIKMVHEGKSIYSNVPFTNSQAVATALMKVTKDLDREQMMVITVDTKLTPTSFTVVAIGGRSYASFDIADIFKTAILSNADGIIIAHNHPSGDPAPSKADIETTKKMMVAGDILGIKVLDHIVLGEDKYVSIVDLLK
ncbi:MAG: JAB domain-containing protein [Lactimicrobium massiliense]|nr:JAB domain-containing protein [Lactimicrobium massiliense]MDD6560794.1 JAB domain-containing protein [Lactimicrobium massiliense]